MPKTSAVGLPQLSPKCNPFVFIWLAGSATAVEPELFASAVGAKPSVEPGLGVTTRTDRSYIDNSPAEALLAWPKETSRRMGCPWAASFANNWIASRRRKESSGFLRQAVRLRLRPKSGAIARTGDDLKPDLADVLIRTSELFPPHGYHRRCERPFAHRRNIKKNNPRALSAETRRSAKLASCPPYKISPGAFRLCSMVIGVGSRVAMHRNM